MSIKIWNAFASNNSGSYVIVGSFPEEALADEVAAELLEVARAQSAWDGKTGDAPLDTLAVKYAIADRHDEDEWPQYDSQDHPAVFAIGHQLFVHASYTVTMPKLLGHLIYKRGGRVQTEVNHAHHPIVATFTMYFPWQHRKELDIPARVQALVDSLCAPDGALSLPQAPAHPAAWRSMTGFGEGDLVLGAAFDELEAGYRAVAAAATAQGAKVGIQIAEAHGDPFAHLRPCTPATVHRLVDVWLDVRGEAPTNVQKTVALERRLSQTAARALIDRAPVVLFENVTLARAEELRAKLSVGNAVVTLRTASSSKA